MDALSRRYFVGICFVILLALTTLLYLTNLTSKATHILPPRISGTILIDPYKLTSFTLIDQNSNKFSNHNLTGGWHLISYGYLHCADICPTSLLLLTRIKEQLINNSYFLNVVFYSVDPKRDRPENLKQYLGFFDDEFIGLTDEDTSIPNNDFADSLGIKAEIETVTVNDSTQTKVSHGVHLFLINPEGNLVAVFKPLPNSIELDDSLPTFDHARLYKDITATIDFIKLKASS